MPIFSLPRPSKSTSRGSLRKNLATLHRSFKEEAQAARNQAQRIGALASRAKAHPLADSDPGPPPSLPDMQEVLREAKLRASKIGAITAGVGAWKESYDLYTSYKAGESITARKVASSAMKVGRRSLQASRSASQRHMTIVSLDTLAKVVAWQSARRASRSITWKALHLVSSKVAGRAGTVMMAVEVFKTMRNDIVRFQDGDLTERDFYINCTLTGVSIVAPVAGASAGPVGGTVGIAVAIGAGMMRK